MEIYELYEYLYVSSYRFFVFLWFINLLYIVRFAKLINR